MTDLGDDVFAAKILKASAGDPLETSAPESALTDLREMEVGAGDTFDPTQWLLVSDDKGEVGVVLPQVFATDLTSGTLFYLAVMPKRRSQGFGRQLHRFGLQRLQVLSVVNYRGSTDAENAPMLAIFTANGACWRADPPCTLQTETCDWFRILPDYQGRVLFLVQSSTR